MEIRGEKSCRYTTTLYTHEKVPRCNRESRMNIGHGHRHHSTRTARKEDDRKPV